MGATGDNSGQVNMASDLPVYRKLLVERPDLSAFTRQRSGDQNPHRPPDKCRSEGMQPPGTESDPPLHHICTTKVPTRRSFRSSYD